MSHFSDDIRRCGSDQDHIGLLGDRNVPDVKLKIPVKSVNHALAARQSLKSKRRDEFCGILRHNDVYFRSGLVQGAGDISHFVGGNAARDSQ